MLMIKFHKFNFCTSKIIIYVRNVFCWNGFVFLSENETWYVSIFLSNILIVCYVGEQTAKLNSQHKDLDDVIKSILTGLTKQVNLIKCFCKKKWYILCLTFHKKMIMFNKFDLVFSKHNLLLWVLFYWGIYYYWINQLFTLKNIFHFIHFNIE